MTHLICIQDGEKWTRQNVCALCGARIAFTSDWTAWSVFADCSQN